MAGGRPPRPGSVMATPPRSATPYTAGFYDGMSDGALTSARVVLREVLDLTTPSSVVDVGCGRGMWLQALGELGVEDVLGIDGPYVEEQGILAIPPDRFVARDLAAGPLVLDRSFDLALALEVAEHLPAERGPSFVADLTRLAPLVLFSAAIPGQGGTGHVHERWQSYWAALFAEHGFGAVDFRRAIWTTPGVEVWYRQNLLLYVAQDHPLASRTTGPVLDLVHPATWSCRPPLSLRTIAAEAPGAVWRTVSFRARRAAERVRRRS